MRTSLAALLSAAVLTLMGCSGATALAPPNQDLSNFDPAVSIDPVSGQTTSVAGAYSIEIDAANRTVDVSPLAPRQGSAIGDLFYLCVEPFGVILEETSYGWDIPNNILYFGYRVEHAFPAPTPPTGRADLGIAGRVVFLHDAPATVNNPNLVNHVDDYTFTFGTDTITLNPKGPMNPDGFYDPAGLLLPYHIPANNTNAFPFKALVDESLDPRRKTPWFPSPPAISNGGVSTGNYAATNSWSAISAWTGTTPTGYGVLHAGQVATNGLVIDLDYSTGLIALVIATYSDPRGGTTAAEKKANRLPKDDPTKFAYAMPHGAVDLERIAFQNFAPAILGSTLNSTVTCDISVVDQDSATSLGPGVTQIPNPSDILSMELASGELGPQDAIVLALVNPGTVESPVLQSGVTIRNTTGTTGGVDGRAYVCVRVVDAQDDAPSGFQKGLTLSTSLAPVPAGQEQRPIVYQVVFVDIV